MRESHARPRWHVPPGDEPTVRLCGTTWPGRASLRDWLHAHNVDSVHQSIDGQAPDALVRLTVKSGPYERTSYLPMTHYATRRRGQSTAECVASDLEANVHATGEYPESASAQLNIAGPTGRNLGEEWARRAESISSPTRQLVSDK